MLSSIVLLVLLMVRLSTLSPSPCSLFNLHPLCPCRCSPLMNDHVKLRCDPSLEKSQFLEKLLTNGLEVILEVRTKLFSEAQMLGLAHVADEIVSRRAVKNGKPLKVKNAEDVWSLSFSIRNNSNVPRVLLKNGKRDRGHP